jgi:hypothetical protein
MEGLTIGVCVDCISLCTEYGSVFALPVWGEWASGGCVLSIWPMAHHPTTEAMLSSPVRYHQQWPSLVCAEVKGGGLMSGAPRADVWLGCKATLREA